MALICSLFKHIIIRRREILCLYLFFILLASIMANPFNIVAQASQIESNEQYYKTKFYGCNDYSSSKVECDPLSNSVDTYRMIGSSKKLYNATNDKPLYTTTREGKSGQALEVDAKYSQ